MLRRQHSEKLNLIFTPLNKSCQMEIVKKIDLTKGVIVITSRHE